MEYSDNSIVSDEVLGIISVSIFILFCFNLGIKYFFERVIPQFLIDLDNFWRIYGFWIIRIALVVCFLGFIYYTYRLVLFSYEKIKENIRKKVIVEEGKKKINELKEEDITSKNVFELVNFGRKVREFLIKSGKYYELEKDVSNLGLTAINIGKRFPIIEAKDELDDLRYERLKLEREIEFLEGERLKKKRNLEWDREAIRLRLRREDKNVYKIKGRTKKEIGVLKQEKYKTINEYCAYEQKVLPVLVRKIMGHNRTHVFLVWSVKRLLNSIPGVSKIQEHNTRDADLTFDYFGKKHAIEVECGSLVRKPKQMANKKEYLNRKYKKRWFVVISNRNLMPKYKSFGTVATRKSTRKVLRKMLDLEEN